MYRHLTIFTGLMLPGAALAHPGHVADVAGHDHWIALGAIGVAAGLGLWAVLKGRKAKAAASDDSAEAEQDSDTEEVHA
ncbi:DUF6732 family protein [Oceanibium sediminis]|uniref:DUF6732 family protein n=1 Tax=Oceanibium sediminis TaxID=2026339 RepID=UPI000DD2BA59|nr:DUF6732 family protein [Oceanibium sediminis]